MNCGPLELAPLFLPGFLVFVSSRSSSRFGGNRGWISESSRRTLGTGSLLMAEAERRLVVVVEGTAALWPYWSTILTDYVEKIAPWPLFARV